MLLDTPSHSAWSESRGVPSGGLIGGGEGWGGVGVGWDGVGEGGEGRDHPPTREGMGGQGRGIGGEGKVG